jgi:hypothetical protein
MYEQSLPFFIPLYRVFQNKECLFHNISTTDVFPKLLQYISSYKVSLQKVPIINKSMEQLFTDVDKSPFHAAVDIHQNH